MVRSEELEKAAAMLSIRCEALSTIARETQNGFGWSGRDKNLSAKIHTLRICMLEVDRAIKQFELVQKQNKEEDEVSNG